MMALLKALDPTITILIIEHDMDVAFEVTNRITVLHYGRVVADGLAHEVKANPLVQEIYLGASSDEGRVMLEVARHPHLLRRQPRPAGRVADACRAARSWAILGRNGMGKTTLIRSIVGFTAPRRGRVVFKDREITGWPSNRIVELGPRPGAAGPPRLSLADGGGEPRGRRARQRRAVERRPGDGPLPAPPRAGRRIAPASSPAASSRCWPSRARSMTNPELLLMDEPTEGLAPLLVREVGRVIESLKARGALDPARRAEPPARVARLATTCTCCRAGGSCTQRA